MSKLTKHQVHKIAMQLLDKMYPAQSIWGGDLLQLASRTAVLHFIKDLDAELDKGIEAWEIIQKCGEQND